MIEVKIEIVNGKIYVQGIETTDATFIGCAMLDFAEAMEHDGMKIVLTEDDVFVESFLTEV